MGFKNLFVKKPTSDDDNNKEATTKKLSAKELRQQKKDNYYKKKQLQQKQPHQQPPSSPSPAPEQAPHQSSSFQNAANATSPRSTSPSSVEANSAASPVPANLDVASVASEGQTPNLVSSKDESTSTPLPPPQVTAMKPSGSQGSDHNKVVETYQPPRLQAEKRKAEAANSNSTPLDQLDHEDRDGGPVEEPTCNYCGCFN